jgi:SAM-dependent methyltransferase
VIRAQQALRAEIAAFGRALREAGYADDVTRLARDVPPPLLRRFARDSAAEPLPDWLTGARTTRVDLLLRGNPVPVEAARAALGGGLDALLACGVLREGEGAIHSDRYMCVPILGNPFVVSRLRHERSERGSIAVYLGPDSFEMAEIGLTVSGRDVLDLGCGGGIVGILVTLGDPARRVVGVDVCREAVDVADLNAALNDVAYEAIHGDLYAPVADRRFDAVLADPPAVPVPGELASPVYGSGGATGDALLRRMVEGAPAVLRPGGRFVAITALHCPAGRIPFVEWLSEWTRAAGGRQASVCVLATSRMPESFYREMGANFGYLPGEDRLVVSPERAGARLATFAEEEGLRFAHWVEVDVRADPDAPSSLSVDWRTPRPTASSRPRPRMSRPELEGLLERHYGDVSAALGDDFGAFLDAATGGATIEQLARRRDLGSEAYLVDLVDALAQLGALEVDEAVTVGGTR